MQKLSAAVRAVLPLVLTGRRSANGVGAYFDLITAPGRKFYGDSFHFGYFRPGVEDLCEALDAHTDLVAEMARLVPGMRVLDVGCGIGAPALRIARRHNCQVVGVNISTEQVRQGNEKVRLAGATGQVTIVRGDARALDFPNQCFDAVLCLEVAGDICVGPKDKDRLVGELYRVLRPGGSMGFSDLVLRDRPTRCEDRALRAVLYHTGSELVTDWPALLNDHGFLVVEHRDILAQVLPTWAHARSVRTPHQNSGYQRWLADQTRARMERIAGVLALRGAFPVLSLRKPPTCTVQPGTVQPGTVQPGTVQPGTVQPGTVRQV